MGQVWLPLSSPWCSSIKRAIKQNERWDWVAPRHNRRDRQLAETGYKARLTTFLCTTCPLMVYHSIFAWRNRYMWDWIVNITPDSLHGATNDRKIRTDDVEVTLIHLAQFPSPFVQTRHSERSTRNHSGSYQNLFLSGWWVYAASKTFFYFYPLLLQC